MLFGAQKPAVLMPPAIPFLRLQSQATFFIIAPYFLFSLSCCVAVWGSMVTVF